MSLNERAFDIQKTIEALPRLLKTEADKPTMTIFMAKHSERTILNWVMMKTLLFHPMLGFFPRKSKNSKRNK